MRAGEPGLSAGGVAHILGVDAARAKRRRSQASHRRLYSEQLCTPHLLTIGIRLIVSGYRCEHPDPCGCYVTPGPPEIHRPRIAVERRFGPGAGFCYLKSISRESGLRRDLFRRRVIPISWDEPPPRQPLVEGGCRPCGGRSLPHSQNFGALLLVYHFPEGAHRPQEAVDDRRTGSRVSPGPPGAGRRRGHGGCRGRTGRLRHGPDPHAGRAGGVSAQAGRIPRPHHLPDPHGTGRGGPAPPPGDAPRNWRAVPLHPCRDAPPVRQCHPPRRRRQEPPGPLALLHPMGPAAGGGDAGTDPEHPPAGPARGPALVRPEPCPVDRFSRDSSAGAPLAGCRGLLFLRERMAERHGPGRPAGPGHPGVGAG